MRTILNKFYFLLFLFSCFLPVTASAASVFFEADKDNFSVGEEFLVSVNIDTETESVNAVEGTVIFPVGLVEIKNIRTGSSNINLWLDQPYIENNSIKFSGITPGGFHGDKNYLFSFVLRGVGVGSGVIFGVDVRSLVNDGLGTKLPIKNKPFAIAVSKNNSDFSNNSIAIQDSELPESFIPVVASDPSIFDGQFFLVFGTQDKNSGLDYFQVKEGEGVFTNATSPYLLLNQELNEKIYVKAIDKAGNERIEILNPQNNQKLYLIVILFVIILSIVFIFNRKKLRFKK